MYPIKWPCAICNDTLVYQDTKKPFLVHGKNLGSKTKRSHEASTKFYRSNFFSLPFASVFVSRPTGLRTSNITTTSVRVEWNPVQERFILGYKVLVQNIPLNQTLPWNKTSALVAGLLSNTKYIISVLPVHGLTLEEHPAGNTASITVTTKCEPGKKNLRVAVLTLCQHFVKYMHIPESSIFFAFVVRGPGTIHGIFQR